MRFVTSLLLSILIFSLPNLLLCTSFDKYNMYCGVSIDTKREFPWQGILHFNKNEICSATLISDQWMLTAASCLTDSNHSNYTVKMRKDKSDKLYSFGILDIKVAPDYDQTKAVGFDLALIKIDETLDFRTDSMIRPICMNKDLRLNDEGENHGEVCAIGWVVDKSKVKFNAAKPKVCSDHYEKRIDWESLKDKVYCAKATNKDICRVQQGSPYQSEILVKDKHKLKWKWEWTLFGVASWGRRTCNDEPDMFTSVQYRYKWISSVTGLQFL